MPTISQFFGILIHMYIRGEHNLPHFHALYAELMEDWNLCRAKQLPKPIKPLE